MRLLLSYFLLIRLLQILNNSEKNDDEEQQSQQLQQSNPHDQDAASVSSVPRKGGIFIVPLYVHLNDI